MLGLFGLVPLTMKKTNGGLANFQDGYFRLFCMIFCFYVREERVLADRRNLSKLRLNGLEKAPG